MSILTSLGVASSAEPTSIPTEIGDVWVSARSAIGQNSVLHANKLGRRANSIIEDIEASKQTSPHAAMKAGGVMPAASSMCDVIYAARTVEHYLPNRTFADLVANARDVFAGRVVALEEGFFRGTPAMLLQVEVGSLQRTSGLIALDSGFALVVYPHATITANNVTLCTRLTVTPPYVPMVGDELMVFSYVQGAGERQIVEVEADRALFAARGGLTIHAPIDSSDLAKPFSEIRQRVDLTFARAQTTNAQ